MSTGTPAVRWPPFDGTFTDAKAIHDTLAAEETNLKSARGNVNTALGVATDAPLATALASLKDRAGGKVSVAMDGTMPKLKATDVISGKVQTGLDAVNGLVSAGGHAVTTGTGLVTQATQLATTVAAFPGMLPSLGLDPMKLASATKIVVSNVKAVTATPQRIDALLKAVEDMYTEIKGAFSG